MANNPVKYVDPSGEYIETALDIVLTGYSLYMFGNAVLSGDINAIKNEGINLALDAGGTLVPFAAGLGTARRVATNIDRLPGDAICVRGGLCTPESFAKGSGVTIKDEKLQNVSVNSKAGLNAAELAKGLPHQKVGVTTVGQIRKVGGDVISSLGSGNHATLSGISPQQASQLFKVLDNLSDLLEQISKTLK